MSNGLNKSIKKQQKRAPAKANKVTIYHDKECQTNDYRSLECKDFSQFYDFTQQMAPELLENNSPQSSNQQIPLGRLDEQLDISNQGNNKIVSSLQDRKPKSMENISIGISEYNVGVNGGCSDQRCSSILPYEEKQINGKKNSIDEINDIEALVRQENEQKIAIQQTRFERMRANFESQFFAPYNFIRLARDNYMQQNIMLWFKPMLQGGYSDNDKQLATKINDYLNFSQSVSSEQCLFKKLELIGSQQENTDIQQIRNRCSYIFSYDEFATKTNQSRSSFRLYPASSTIWQLVDNMGQSIPNGFEQFRQDVAEKLLRSEQQSGAKLVVDYSRGENGVLSLISRIITKQINWRQPFFLQ